MTADALSEAIATEETARDLMIEATAHAKAAQIAQQEAYRAFQTASRRRQVVYLQTRHRAVIRGLPMPTLASQPPNDPKAERLQRGLRVRNAAFMALRSRGGTLLALELATLIGIPARAVRNYLDQDPRFVIDHVHYKDRGAVRVTLSTTAG